MVASARARARIVGVNIDFAFGVLRILAIQGSPVKVTDRDGERRAILAA
jgi:predicted amino acid dehydrogenase